MSERSVTDMIRVEPGDLPYITGMRTVRGGRTVFVTFASPEEATEVVDKLRWLKTHPREHEHGERTSAYITRDGRKSITRSGT